ncbi:PRD domain-containing protein [Entomospira entomophila]|uniref:PRD domain-containing protein n=1 Tax=Entomospira entomophila TaxID=2719988 RepID=A0A968G7P2_9SPIO|nr:PRD domain-containing protein [Entomospira entomophilus]NIZ40098.1 PRD domain-containing protein [Entomospira entomophilus]WDI35658.1 PRD domain-containing protein [Entomospira entomophilus]
MEKTLLKIQELENTSEQAYHFICAVRQHIHHLLRGSQSEIFLMHLTMAHVRQERADAVIPPIPAIIKTEIEKEANYDLAKKICQEILGLSDVSWHDNELDYIHAHLVVLLS